MSDAASRPAVLAIVVATNGEATLPRTLASLDAQEHDDLTVVAVDNGSTDGSRDLLVRALGRRHVLVAERDLGFGGAVAMALDAEVSRGHDLVLFVHDDLELRTDAVQHLVDVMQRDDDLAVVGCKLVDWESPEQLQAVGMSVDVTGRADPGVEPDEIDQGQRDHEARTLYVSTAGMLVRRDRFEALGRFDHRYHLFRDDLDLCWRAWLRGWSVEVVPEAVALHEASASTYRRLGQTAFLGPRYFAERNTLATLLKNYGAARLLYVVPLFLVVGVAKVLGFVATRRLGDAWQTLRAWAWNVLHLRETRRLRRRVQEHRVVGDRELQPLFAQVTARIRAYGEALGDLVSGGSDEIGLDDPHEPVVPSPSFGERVRTTLRTSPIGVAGVLLVLLGAVVSVPLLGRSALQGGDLAAWPPGVLTLLRGYVAPWDVGDLPAVVGVTPGQALLSLPALLTGGSTWAAPRLLLLSVVPIAWFSALRAGKLVTRRRLPRVAGATLYALAPPVLAALRTGRIGIAVAAALLPLLVIAAARATLPGVPLDRAWRATAATALLAAAIVAFAPATLWLVVVAVLASGVAIAVGSSPDATGRALRLTTAAAGATLLLLPWTPDVGGLGGPEGVAAGAQSLWRLLLLTPELPGFPGPWAGTGLAVAVLVGLAFGGPRAGAAAGLAAVHLAGVGLAWNAARLGAEASVWPGAPLTVSALAAAGLLAIAFAMAEEQLAAHDFGWRQLASAGAAVFVVVGLVASGASITRSAWDGYGPDRSPLPAFLASQVQAEGVGPFRVLVVADDGEDGVGWAITDADGPTLASWGHEIADGVAAGLERRVDDLVAGRDPSVAAELGHLGVRYVVVPEDGRSDRLERALRAQLDLVDQPVATGLVQRVTTWLPRWSVVPADAAPLLAAGRPLPPGTAPEPLVAGQPVPAGLLVLADPARTDRPAWVVEQDGNEIEAAPAGDVLAWPVAAGDVVVAPVGQTRRFVLLTVQLLLLGLAVSLSLRAPGFARTGRR